MRLSLDGRGGECQYSRLATSAPIGASGAAPFLNPICPRAGGYRPVITLLVALRHLRGANVSLRTRPP